MIKLHSGTFIKFEEKDLDMLISNLKLIGKKGTEDNKNDMWIHFVTDGESYSILIPSYGMTWRLFDYPKRYDGKRRIITQKSSIIKFVEKEHNKSKKLTHEEISSLRESSIKLKDVEPTKKQSEKIKVGSTIKYGSKSYNMLVNELNLMSKQELYDYCKKYGIKGYSGKTKAQRVDLIVEYRSDVKMDRISRITRKVKKYPKEYPYRQSTVLSNDIDYVRDQIKKEDNYRKKIELKKLEDKLMVMFRDF